MVSKSFKVLHAIRYTLRNFDFIVKAFCKAIVSGKLKPADLGK